MNKEEIIADLAIAKIIKLGLKLNQEEVKSYYAIIRNKLKEFDPKKAIE